MEAQPGQGEERVQGVAAGRERGELSPTGKWSTCANKVLKQPEHHVLRGVAVTKVARNVTRPCASLCRIKPVSYNWFQESRRLPYYWKQLRRAPELGFQLANVINKWQNK